MKPTFLCAGKGDYGSNIYCICGNKRLNLTNYSFWAWTAEAVIDPVYQIYWLYGHMGFDQNKLLVLTQAL